MKTALNKLHSALSPFLLLMSHEGSVTFVVVMVNGPYLYSTLQVQLTTQSAFTGNIHPFAHTLVQQVLVCTCYRLHSAFFSVTHSWTRWWTTSVSCPGHFDSQVLKTADPPIGRQPLSFLSYSHKQQIK